MNAVRIAVTIAGLLYAALGLLQIVTGRVLSVRRIRSSMDPNHVKAGGWVGIGAGSLLAAAGLSGLLGDATGDVLAAIWFALLAFAGLWGLVGLFQRKRASSGK